MHFILYYKSLFKKAYFTISSWHDWYQFKYMNLILHKLLYSVVPFWFCVSADVYIYRLQLVRLIYISQLVRLIYITQAKKYCFTKYVYFSICAEEIIQKQIFLSSFLAQLPSLSDRNHRDESWEQNCIGCRSLWN